jgi:hypothetical protein
MASGYAALLGLPSRPEIAKKTKILRGKSLLLASNVAHWRLPRRHEWHFFQGQAMRREIDPITIRRSQL